MRDLGLRLSDDKLDELFQLLDSDRSGFIDYEEFLTKIKGGLNDFRRNLVRQVFQAVCIAFIFFCVCFHLVQ